MSQLVLIKTIVLLSILIVLCFAACHHKTIKGSGNVSSDTRSVSNFSSIEVSAALKVIYTEGTDYSLEVIGDDNLVKYITTEIHGDELQIGIEKGKRFKHVTKMEIHVTSPSLAGIEASGASSFEATDTIHTSGLSLRLSGASTASFSAIMTSINADLSGASNATISGTADSVYLSGSGASIYRTTNLTAATAVINFSGASAGAILAQNTLSATLSGASSLDYYGNPGVTVNSSGGSSINKR